MDRKYYLKSDGTRCDIARIELQKMCLYPDGEFNNSGLKKVLEILGYDYDFEIVKKSYDFINNKISPQKEFKLGQYLRLINLGRKNEDDNEEIELSLNDKIIKSLENDIVSLLRKLESTLKNDNFSNYKMLINNLKDTVDLKQELEKGDNPKVNQVYNIKVDLPNANSTDDIIKALKDLPKNIGNTSY